jgi:hypothetical protein
MTYRLIAFFILILAAATTSAQRQGRFPNILDVKTSGAAAGRLHFDPATLSKFAVTAQDIATSAGSILKFQADTWNFAGPVFWDLYVTDQRVDKAANFGATAVSATEKVPGATKPGPMACVTLLTLNNINSILASSTFTGNDTRFSSRLAFAMAHEATHCFQRITSKLHNSTVAYSPASWFMEGSASWLAGDYLEGIGLDYPSYFELGFRKEYQVSMLTRNPNDNHFFFKWLEGKQALKTRAEVMNFVRDLLNTPWSDCVTILPFSHFLDEETSYPKIKTSATTPYEKVLKDWFATHRQTTIANVLSLFGSAVVRGTVPGIRAPNLYLTKTKLTILPGFNMARGSVLVTGVPAPVPLGKIAPFSKHSGGKQKLPEPFGFLVFEVSLSRPLIPPPIGYDISMEGVDDDISGHLSSEKSDDVLDPKRGWIRTKFLEGNWISVARSDPTKALNTHVLFRALP